MALDETENEFAPEDGDADEFRVTDDGKIEQNDDHNADFEEDLTFDD